MKKLFISIFTAVFALFALGTSTFAWFSMNTQAKASGMQVKAIAGSSLQVSDSTNFESGKTAHEFTQAAYAVKPATRYDSQNGVSSEPDSHLVAVKNTGEIDPATGLKKADGEDLIYEAASTPSSATVNGFYVDYVLYFAAEGTDQKLTQGTLKLTIAPVNASVFTVTTVNNEPTVTSDPVLKATKVMVLYRQAGTPSYNVCDNDILLTTGATGDNVFEICDLSSSLYIPASVNGNTEHNDALEVVLRVYVDGALKDGTDKTFVRNTAIVDLSKALGFSATFDLITE